MNTESLNRHLAEKVMGWKYDDSENFAVYVDQANEFCCQASDWNPAGNISQSIDCAIKEIEYWGIKCTASFRQDYNYCTAWARKKESDRIASVTEHDNPATALSLAIAKATGWEG